MLPVYAAIVGAIVAFFVCRAKGDNDNLAFATIATGALVGVFSFLVLLAGTMVLSDTIGVEYPSTRTELVIMRDGQSTYGAFFLGCGYIDEDMSYVWYQKESNGSKTLKDVPACYGAVFEDSAEPYLFHYRVGDFKNSVARHFFLTPGGFAGMDFPEYEFHIPPGTLKQSIVLDAE